MNDTPKTSGIRRHMALWLALVLLLTAVYSITFSGQVEIADQLQYFDAVANTARFGDGSQGLALWQWMPATFYPQQPHLLRQTIAEPGFIAAAVPLYWLAERVPGFGLVHTTWLFNIVMTALVASFSYLYALRLGYRAGVGVLAALALGLLTILWPYSQTFFREPLMMLFLIGAALLLESTRTAERLRTRILCLLAAIFALVLAFVSKEAALLALPGLLVILTPDRFWRLRWVQRISDLLLVAALVLAALVAFTGLMAALDSLLPETRLLGRFGIEPDFTRTALHTYLFSIGGSLWGTSPVLLLALPGAWWLLRGERPGGRRIVWTALLVVYGYAFSYALFRGGEWFGGTIWPQRFLMPVVPFALLPALPVFERLLRRPINRLLWAAFALVALYSLWWQVSGLMFRWEAYSRATFEESFGGLVYWGPGFNVIEFIRPVVLAGEIGREPLNIAWARAGIAWAPLAFTLIAAAAGGLLLRLLRGPARRSVLALALVAAAWVVLTGLGLRALYERDPAYMADRDDLHQIVEVIRAQVAPGDVLVLNDPTYVDFFYNYGKFDRHRVVVHDYHPGDRGSCEQPLTPEQQALIDAADPAAGLGQFSGLMMHHLAATYDRIWLLMSSGPEIPCVVRPLERFMGERYYRLTETSIEPRSPLLRLIAYDPTSAPNPDGFLSAEIPTDLIYTDASGQSIALAGYTLPRGRVYAPGETLPLSLSWQTLETTPTELYTVAWFLADASGVVVEGENTWPGATFAPTTTLTPGVAAWDHRALVLPPDLPPGEYRLWVLLYALDASGAPSDLRVSGAETANGVVGVLPGTIEVRAGE